MTAGAADSSEPLSRFAGVWGILVPSPIPTPQEVTEARAVDFILLMALRCVTSVCLLGLALLMLLVDFVPQLAVALVMVVWVMHIAFTVETVWRHWSAHRQRLVQMEREYRRFRRAVDQPS